MKLDQIISHYISQIPKFPELNNNNFSGNELYNHFCQKAKFHEIEAFNNLRFNRKFKEYIETQDQHDWLRNKAKEINEVSQKLFNLKFSS